MAELENFNQALIEQGLLIPCDVPGVVGRSAEFEAIVSGFDGLIVEIAQTAGAEHIEFPPVVSRELIRRVSYMDTFPELLGSIHSYRESSAKHDDLVKRVAEGGDWGEHLEQMPITLCPAACYPVYPICSGTLPPAGRHFNLSSWVFRAETESEPGRLQSFRQRENVRVADSETVRQWRDDWTLRAVSLLSDLGLHVDVQVASDPFIGRSGEMLAANQIAGEGKYEIVCPVALENDLTAIASFNHHHDKFGRAFGIRLPNGDYAETACVGFGLERVALALLRAHGVVASEWPLEVRTMLSL